MSVYYLLANIGFDTAENEPSKVCPKGGAPSKYNARVPSLHSPAARVLGGRGSHPGARAEPNGPRAPGAPRRRAARWLPPASCVPRRRSSLVSPCGPSPSGSEHFFCTCIAHARFGSVAPIASFDKTKRHTFQLCLCRP